MDRPAQKGKADGVDAPPAFGDVNTGKAFDIGDATQLANQNQLLARPRSGTVAHSILAALESGRPLTAGMAWREFGCSRLAAVVHELRRLGWRIQARTVEVRCVDGRTAHVAAYSLGEAENAGSGAS